MLICFVCRKPKEEFAISPRTQQPTKVCVECWNVHYAHLAKSPAYHKEKLRKEGRATRKKQIERNRNYLFSVLKHAKCMDCSYDNWIALELDHRDPKQKHDAVTRMVNDGTTLDRIKQEVAKCDVVCANCHAIRTAKQSNSWRITLPTEVQPLNLTLLAVDNSL